MSRSSASDREGGKGGGGKRKLFRRERKGHFKKEKESFQEIGRSILGKSHFRKWEETFCERESFKEEEGNRKKAKRGISFKEKKKIRKQTEAFLVFERAISGKKKS